MHAAFVLFVVAGGLLVLRWPRAVWFHAPAVLWGAIVELAGLGCPLTPLEHWLRALGGEPGSAGGFVERWLLPVLYPAALGRELQIALGVGVLVLNGLVYAWVLRRRALDDVRARAH